MKAYDVITSRSYYFDRHGQFAPVQREEKGFWNVNVAEREILIPSISIKHCHPKPLKSSGTRHGTRHGTQTSWLESVDGTCACGEGFPINILENVYSIIKTKTPQLYGAVERGAYCRLDLLKMLADNWYMDENTQQTEPSLFHVCNDNHPAYLYYGKGIPLSQIAMPPNEDKCKTCRKEIPKGIRIALLMKYKKVRLT